MDEGRSNLEVWATAIEELKALQQRPVVLSHDVGGQRASGTALASD